MATPNKKPRISGDIRPIPENNPGSQAKQCNIRSESGGVGGEDSEDISRSDESDSGHSYDGNYDVDDGKRSDENSDADDLNDDVDDSDSTRNVKSQRSNADDGIQYDDGSGDVPKSGDIERDASGPDDIKGPFLDVVSIYKIQFAELEGDSDMQSLQSAIIKKLTISDRLVHNEQIRNNVLGNFNVEWFCHCTKEKFNLNSSKISIKFTGSDQSKISGDKRSGNIQAFYRFKKSQPEVFLISDGSAYQFILKHADPQFRTNFAITYIDENNISKLEKYCLAGADLSTCTTFKSEQTIHNIELEEYIASITSNMRTDTKLSDILVKGSGEQSRIKIDIGLKKVRIEKRMTFDELAEVLDVISSELENVHKVEGPLVQAFKNVQQINNTSKIEHLRQLMYNKFLRTITDNGIIDDLYLSHRFPDDFHTRSSFKLKVENTQITEWHSVPTVHDVIAKLKHHFSESLCMESLVGSGSNSILGNFLEKEKIVLSFTIQGKSESEPIQNCVHGCVSDGDDMYHKMLGKWFRFHSSFFENIDRNFSKVVEKCHYEDDEILKFPWKYKSGIAVEEHCEILNMKKEELKGLLEVLDTEIYIVKNDKVCLTEQSFMIPDVAKLCKDTDKIKTKQETDNSDGSVRKLLWACRSGVSEAPTMQKLRNKPVKVCNRTNDTFKVVNPVLDEELLSKVLKKFPKLKENDVLSFLKSMMPLKEGDFNELFLFCEQPGYTVFPGDRILSNKIELFDILIHQEKTKKTFLIHTKDKLNHSTRASCSQIRNSADLLWHDFVRGHNNHLSLWWEYATETKSGDVYRQLLKKKLEGIGKKAFLQMFSNEITVVFVLAFRSSNKTPCLSVEFRPIKANDFARWEHDGNKIFDILVKNEYVTQTGFLTDRLLTLTTQKKFITECKEQKILTEYSPDVQIDIYKKLKEIGMYNLSTIAKLELLTLERTFNKYQTGSRKYYELRLLELKSC